MIVGHNQRIDWGLKNLGPTVEDVYVETFNSDGRYLTPDGWKQPEHHREVIRVKGTSDVVLDVAVTRHGPIVTEMVPGETRRLALRWTLYDGLHSPFFAVDSAQRWEEFRRAFSELDAPGQNVVYADVDGNIGYQATGKIPIRAAGDGSLTETAATTLTNGGLCSFEKLPAYSSLRESSPRRWADCAGWVSIFAEHGWGSVEAETAVMSIGVGHEVSAVDMLALETISIPNWIAFSGSGLCMRWTMLRTPLPGRRRRLRSCGSGTEG